MEVLSSNPERDEIFTASIGTEDLLYLSVVIFLGSAVAQW